ncbi:MAG: ATP-binding cassette domain-containing protein, partial [Actinomycetota bacterium]
AGKVRAAIGVAHQDAAIDPLMTGRELLRLQSVLHGIPGREAKQRGELLLDRVGLTAAGDRRVGTYSGGMRRRLDLALSLVHEPSVLFLDEPTTGLDPTSRMALWEEVQRLNREVGTTIFLTTQYLEEADQLAGRVGIIDHGQIVETGSPSALKAAVGSPTLRFDVHEHDREAIERVLAGFGERRPARSGRVAIGLEGGSGRIAEVVRALDDAGLHIHRMELDEPSLDDVFAEATGRRLEGAEESSGGDEE